MVERCHTPPMTGNDKHTTSKPCDGWGMVYGIVYRHHELSAKIIYCFWTWCTKTYRIRFHSFSRIGAFSSILNHVLNPYRIGPKIWSEVQIIGSPGKRTWGCRMGSSMQLIKHEWDWRNKIMESKNRRSDYFTGAWKVTPPKLGLQSKQKWAVKYQTLIMIEPPNNRYILVVGVPGGKHSPFTWL